LGAGHLQTVFWVFLTYSELRKGLSDKRQKLKDRKHQ